MIRFIACNAFIGIYTIIMCVYGLILSLFDKNGYLMHKYAAFTWARVILFVCGVKLEVKGLEDIDQDRAYIYVSNHQGAFDIFTVLAGLRVNFRFILKKELMKIPLLGYAMSRVGHISIDRADIRKAVKGMDRAAEKAREGISILMFPEGTRSENGDVKAFKKGAYQVALKSGCDIVPIAISGSKDVVPKGSMRINSGKIRLSIGNPIPIKDYTKKDIDQLIAKSREAIIGMMSEETI